MPGAKQEHIDWHDSQKVAVVPIYLSVFVRSMIFTPIYMGHSCKKWDSSVVPVSNIHVLYTVGKLLKSSI